MNRNLIGARAEWMFDLAITKPIPGTSGNPKNLFQAPVFLGDKFPTLDMVVFLENRPELFFFAQITGTAAPDDAGKLHLSKNWEKLQKLYGFFPPTYLFIVDEAAEHVYIKSMNRFSDTIKGISTFSPDIRYLLSGQSLVILEKEIRDFWARHTVLSPKLLSSF